jgi:hypothetical protein
MTVIAVHKDPQSRTMRFIRLACAKGAGEKLFPGCIFRPGLPEQTHEREQDWATGQRNDGCFGAHDIPARIDDERIRCNQRLDLIEPKDRSRSHATSRAAGASNACTARSTSTFNAAFPTPAAALFARSSASRRASMPRGAFT